MEKWMVLIYDDGSCEVLRDKEKKLVGDAVYWTKRRIEKGGKYLEGAYIADRQLDAQAIVKRAEREHQKEHEESIKRDELRELERLKSKYEN